MRTSIVDYKVTGAGYWGKREKTFNNEVIPSSIVDRQLWSHPPIIALRSIAATDIAKELHRVRASAYLTFFLNFVYT